MIIFPLPPCFKRNYIKFSFLLTRLAGLHHLIQIKLKMKWVVFERSSRGKHFLPKSIKSRPSFLLDALLWQYQHTHVLCIQYRMLLMNIKARLENWIKFTEKGMGWDGWKVHAIEKNCPVPLSFGRFEEAFLVESTQRQIECDKQGSVSEQVCLHWKFSWWERKAAYARNWLNFSHLS